jgi:hypothetical protein
MVTVMATNMLTPDDRFWANMPPSTLRSLAALHRAHAKQEVDQQDYDPRESDGTDPSEEFLDEVDLEGELTDDFTEQELLADDDEPPY